ncbi:glycosyltransferase family 4 protein [Streptomyces lycii]|uniref:D-inositol 3-phosphate glycosyltransferase n=1 Tax=Streptomyces lycii TaxID=2654337 RepID=A0ABQ7FGD3_9ACTN|nr:glycosyltransferase family 4 protein [Streptomyces lycii]KAF4408106.1 glycosyltransferase family 4 protein [Streptomyces lycii]
MPGGVGDTAAPSGGNTYDRRVCRELLRAGWQVEEHAVDGDWPHPGGDARAELARILAASADGSVVLLDGLVACGVPDIVVPEAGRLRIAVLVHLPLADETGLAPDTAAVLDVRERRTLRAVDAVVATGEWAARRLVEHHGLAPYRVHTAAPGVDPAPLATGSAPGAGPRLLCVASVTPRKGQHRLVEALAELTGPAGPARPARPARPAGPAQPAELAESAESAGLAGLTEPTDTKWRCDCAGGLGQNPGYVARVRRLIAERGLGDRFRLTGPLVGADLDARYAGADLLLLASSAETYGMAVTEALARGVPVLATAVGGVPEAVGRAPDGTVPGLLVPPGDQAALTGALRRWLTDPCLRDRTRAAARARRTVLAGWDTTARELAGALDHLLRVPRRTA